MDNTDFSPDWQGILMSAVWTEQIEPWLKAMYQDTLEFRAGLNKAPMFNAEAMSIEEFHFWRGFCAAIKAVLETPQESIERNRLKVIEDEENARRSTDANNVYRARHAGF